MLKKIVISSAFASMLLVGNLYANCHSNKQAQNSQKSMHGSHQKGHSQHGSMHMVQNVIKAASKSGINTEQAAKITEAINTFKGVQRGLKQSKMFPIDALQDDKFDANIFMDAKSKMFTAKMEAVTELFETVYAVLTPQQRKTFKREFTAPMVEKMIRKGMIKNHKRGMSCK
ncbi:MAG: hypothetical protein ABXS93_05505 [Sulfurimonas sp.]